MSRPRRPRPPAAKKAAGRKATPPKGGAQSGAQKKAPQKKGPQQKAQQKAPPKKAVQEQAPQEQATRDQATEQQAPQEQATLERAAQAKAAQAKGAPGHSPAAVQPVPEHVPPASRADVAPVEPSQEPPVAGPAAGDGASAGAGAPTGSAADPSPGATPDALVVAATAAGRDPATGAGTEDGAGERAAASPPGAAPSLGRRLLANARPRFRRVDVSVAVLLLALGFAAAVQVRSTQDDGVLASARQEDLVRILDDLDSRSERLRQEVDALAAARQRLTSGSDSRGAALAEARRRAQVLGVLAGTLPAVGPGISLEITDPEARVRSDLLLDALQELRDAGAEAVQIEGQSGRGAKVRVVASTAFVDAGDGIEVDGVRLTPPYRFLVVGDPAVLGPAMGIPGGVVDRVRREGGQALVERRERVEVSALRPFEAPRYARPAPEQGSGGD